MKNVMIKEICSQNQNCTDHKLEGAFEYAQKQYQKFDMDISYAYEVLKILMQLKPDDATVVAVLLYPLYLIDKISDAQVKDNFGETVLSLLLSVKRIESLDYAQNDKSSQLEVLRKMFLAMAKDLRGIMISLAFRLYKMQYLDQVLDKGTKEILAKETLYVYVPVAERLGVYRIKTKLEDLAFKYANPDDYEFIAKQLERLGKSRKTVMGKVKKELEDFLKDHDIEAEVFGRIKSIYSIYKKMQRKNLSSIDDLYDIFAMRVIIPSEYDQDEKEKVDRVYRVLGMVHGRWKPISKRFKDYIAVPKPNGYMSLHTVVLGLAPKDMDQPVEIQFRTKDMHLQAENGIASHWLYKSSTNSKVGSFESKIEWIRNLEKLTEKITADGEGMKEVELEIFKDRIFVLTPRGEVKDLPYGSCPIDFAYMVHTDIGHSCVMAKVNGSVVSLDYKLKNGDVVNIITKKGSHPKLQWLSIVASSSAKSKIKAWFSSQERESNLKEGKRLINAQLERLGQSVLDQNYSILKNYNNQSLNLAERETILEEVGKGSQLATDIIRKIYPYKKLLLDDELAGKRKADQEVEDVSEEDQKDLQSKVLVGGEANLPIKFASCCSPAYGDKIVAYVTRGNRITIHKFACTLLNSLNTDRVIHADWAGMRFCRVPCYSLKVKIKALSRVGLAKEIIDVIAGMGINIRDMSIKTLGQFGRLIYTLDFDNLSLFDDLIDRLMLVEGVLEVTKG